MKKPKKRSIWQIIVIHLYVYGKRRERYRRENPGFSDYWEVL